MQTQTTITATDVALFPVVAQEPGSGLEVVAVAYVRIIDGTIVAGIEGDVASANYEPLTFEAGELNDAVRYASSLAGHDLDVRPAAPGHGY